MLTGKSEKPQLIFAPRENKVNPAPKKGTIIPLMDRWPSISRSTLLRGLIPALILGVWAALMAWLIRTEAFPEFFDTRSPGYRGLAHSGTLLVDRWMVIRFNNASIGYSYTVVDIDETTPDRQILIENETHMSLKILDTVQSVRVTSRANLDAFYHLQTFHFSIVSRGYSATLSGRRIRDRTFRVLLSSSGAQQHLHIDIPDDAVLYSPLTDMMLQRLQPGQSVRVRLFNPATLAVTDVPVRALRQETLTVFGTNTLTTVLEADVEGLTMTSWMDAEGRILRQTTPLGWTLVAATPEEAVGPDDSAAAEDLLAAMAVPCTPPIDQPRAQKRLDLTLLGPAKLDRIVESPRQIIRGRTPGTLKVRLYADDAVPPAESPAPDPAVSSNDLAATLYIQSDHPLIRRQAESITGGRTSAWEKAVALHDWVYKNVDKKPTISLPSALDVLKQRQGDCNEHTYLFVALARAAGLPARVRVGIVYQNGAFYYHAWPAVFVDRWREMDPTFGQLAVDATHLALLDGELADQMQLLGPSARLQIPVESAAPPPGGPPRD